VSLRSKRRAGEVIVPGATFYQKYDAVTFIDQSFPATISSFRLDKYEITVGRFRRFVEAWIRRLDACETTTCGDGIVGCTLADLLAVGSRPAGSAKWSEDTGSIEIGARCARAPQ